MFITLNRSGDGREIVVNMATIVAFERFYNDGTILYADASFHPHQGVKIGQTVEEIRSALDAGSLYVTTRYKGDRR